MSLWVQESNSLMTLRDETVPEPVGAGPDAAIISVFILAFKQYLFFYLFITTFSFLLLYLF